MHIRRRCTAAPYTLGVRMICHAALAQADRGLACRCPAPSLLTAQTPHTHFTVATPMSGLKIRHNKSGGESKGILRCRSGTNRPPRMPRPRRSCARTRLRTPQSRWQVQEKRARLLLSRRSTRSSTRGQSNTAPGSNVAHVSTARRRADVQDARGIATPSPSCADGPTHWPHVQSGGSASGTPASSACVQVQTRPQYQTTRSDITDADAGSGWRWTSSCAAAVSASFLAAASTRQSVHQPAQPEGHGGG
eukprot:3775392-Rhodomonas_salina.3